MDTVACVGVLLHLVESRREEILAAVGRHRGTSVAVFGSVARSEDTVAPRSVSGPYVFVQQSASSRSSAKPAIHSPTSSKTHIYVA